VPFTISSAISHIPPRFAGFDGSGFRSAVEADAIGPKNNRRVSFSSQRDPLRRRGKQPLRRQLI